MQVNSNPVWVGYFEPPLVFFAKKEVDLHVMSGMSEKHCKGVVLLGFQLHCQSR